jgi:hypothetical protein
MENADLTDSERQKLLGSKICELPLVIPGTPLETALHRLYSELDKAGIVFKPGAYLSDEWGCPSGVPVVGVPFYLADAKVYQVVSEFTFTHPINGADLIRFFRHETGHALNYAYHLYGEPGWEETFGRYSKPYNDIYKTVPFSTRFVRYSSGWYAEKHPDEDFAETFAVWLDPDSRWREVYADTPALAKLDFIDALIGRCGRNEPFVTGGKLDRPVAELGMTVAEWCKENERAARRRVKLPGIIDLDLRRLFPDTVGFPASVLFSDNRKLFVQSVNGWTGINRGLLNALVGELSRRTEILGLKVSRDKTEERIVGLAAFISALSMNYQRSHRFMPG